MRKVDLSIENQPRRPQRATTSHPSPPRPRPALHLRAARARWPIPPRILRHLQPRELAAPPPGHSHNLLRHQQASFPHKHAENVDKTSPSDLPSNRINPPRASPRPQARPPLRVGPKRHNLPPRSAPGRPGDAGGHVHGVFRRDRRAPPASFRRHLPAGDEDRLLRRRTERGRLLRDVTSLPGHPSTIMPPLLFPTHRARTRNNLLLLRGRGHLSPALDGFHRLLPSRVGVGLLPPEDSGNNLQYSSLLIVAEAIFHVFNHRA